MPVQGGLSIERMCQLAEVSRVGFYRYLRAGWPAEEEVNLQSAVQDVVLEHRWRYGYRRVTAELQARGMIVNHKRIARIMREDNLLAFHRERHLPEDKVRGTEIYLNLAARMKVSAPNQLWIADITYIRLKGEFVYLAVMLDSFSRRVIGWALGRTLQTKLPLHALERAIVNSTTAARSRAPLRSGRAVCLRTVHPKALRSSDAAQHEQTGKSIRQCHLREFSENAQARRDLRQRVPRLRRFAPWTGAIHRRVLQQMPFAFSLVLSVPGKIRGRRCAGRTPRGSSGTDSDVFWHLADAIRLWT